MEDSTFSRELESRMNSGKCEIQISALREVKQVISKLSSIAVEGFKRTDNPVIFANELRTLGPAIVPSLGSVFESYGEGESRTILAILLLSFGDRRGVADALGALRMNNPNQFLAASKLAEAGVIEAAEKISQLLREHALNETLAPEIGPKLGALINALQTLGVAVPADVRARLTSPNVSPLVASYLSPQTRDEGR